MLRLHACSVLTGFPPPSPLPLLALQLQTAKIYMRSKFRYVGFPPALPIDEVFPMDSNVTTSKETGAEVLNEKGGSYSLPHLAACVPFP